MMRGEHARETATQKATAQDADKKQQDPEKNRALTAMAAEIRASEAKILEANRGDVAQAKENGRDAAFLDRMTLTPKLVAQMAEGLEQVVALPDPVGQVSERTRRPTGIEVDEKVRPKTK